MENTNPTVFDTSINNRPKSIDDENDDIEDIIDSQEIFDLIRHINDPEHPV